MAHPEAVRTYRQDERRDASDGKRERRAERRQHRPLTGELAAEQKLELVRRAQATILAQRKERAARKSDLQET